MTCTPTSIQHERRASLETILLSVLMLLDSYGLILVSLLIGVLNLFMTCCLLFRISPRVVIWLAVDSSFRNYLFEYIVFELKLLSYQTRLVIWTAVFNLQGFQHQSFVPVSGGYGR